jgi:hypothetical protein
MWIWRRIPDGFPKGFRVQRIRSIDAKTFSDLPASDIARYFRENSYVARRLLAEASGKRFTPSTFISEKSDGLFRVGWFTRAAKYDCVKEFQHLEDAATDYVLFSLGKGRWTPTD